MSRKKTRPTSFSSAYQAGFEVGLRLPVQAHRKNLSKTFCQRKECPSIQGRPDVEVDLEDSPK